MTDIIAGVLGMIVLLGGVFILTYALTLVFFNDHERAEKESTGFAGFIIIFVIITYLIMFIT